MTQYEREELVEHYLSGEMSSAEEGEFFLVAAVDEELQRTLKAYRIMDRAMVNDRNVAVTENSDYRGRVMGMLAASHVAAPAGSGTGSGAGLSGGSVSTGGAATGGSLWKGIGASILGASLVGGMIVAVASIEPTPTGAINPGAMRQTPAQSAPVSTETPAPVSGTVDAPSAKDATAEPAEPVTGRREIARGTAKRSEKSTVSETATKEETVPRKRTDYLQLPPEGNKDVKIRVEVSDPKK